MRLRLPAITLTATVLTAGAMACHPPPAAFDDAGHEPDAPVSSGGQKATGGSSTGGTSTGGKPASSGGVTATGGVSTGGVSATGGTSTGGASGGSAGSAVAGRGAGGRASGGAAGVSSSSSGGSGGSGGAAGAGAGTGGKSGSGGAPVMCTPPSGGTQGYTTRFWDCCKPSCAWSQNAGGHNPVKTCSKTNQTVGSGNQSACSNGDAYACWDMAPWAVSDTQAYAYAAFNGGGCGTCYELSFTGQSNNASGDPGAMSLCGKKLTVQVINIGNISQGQFDIMIPGGGVGDFNACSNQWGVSTSALGEKYGGVMLACQKKNNDLEPRKQCTSDGCKTLFSSSNLSQLLAGCQWTVDWLNTADNPKVSYKQVTCPNELTSKSGFK